MSTLSRAANKLQFLLALHVTRIVIAVVSVMLPFLPVQGIAFKLLDHTSLLLKVCQFLGICCSYALYCYYVHKVERRTVGELSRDGAGRESLGGAAIGALLFGAVMAGLALAGAYRVTAIRPLCLLKNQ